MKSRYSKLVFDLDGTLYRGRSSIPSAVETINHLKNRADLLFLSNNGNQSATALAQRLRTLGFNVSNDEVISSVTITVEYVSSLQQDASIFVLNSGDLPRALQAAGHRLVAAEEAQFVVVGVDMELTYDKLAQGLFALRNGARFIATNTDAVYPREEGVYPAAGAIVGAFRGMGFEPEQYCGKPDRWAVEKALSLRGMRIGLDCLMVGDHLETDIVGAQNIGVDSVLVLTGVSTREEMIRKGIHPTYVIRDLSELEPILFSDSGSPGG
ncbi:HAD-IIA family hydrolase [Candidatus Bipolaricaulota bacterium]|nr:HAD-IIA family hydrolase [Candidatus Bipolaricaulota bacterium]MCK4681773.1 HAD-IIA family hydrolase [Candidatus Bipolaricaulota bacterium]